MTPEGFIGLMRRTFGRYPDYSGGCLKFHAVLLKAFPEGEGYYNSNHVITLIDGKFWDIDGEYKGDVSGFVRIRLKGYGKRKTGHGIGPLLRSFSHLIENNERTFLLNHYKKRLK